MLSVLYKEGKLRELSQICLLLFQVDSHFVEFVDRDTYLRLRADYFIFGFLSFFKTEQFEKSYFFFKKVAKLLLKKISLIHRERERQFQQEIRGRFSFLREDNLITFCFVVFNLLYTSIAAAAQASSPTAVG